MVLSFSLKEIVTMQTNKKTTVSILWEMSRGKLTKEVAGKKAAILDMVAKRCRREKVPLVY